MRKVEISFRDIKKGDIIERWGVKMVRNNGGTFDHTDEWELKTTKRAVENTTDLARRWCDENGELLHGSHDGCVDMGPIHSRYEKLYRVEED